MSGTPHTRESDPTELETLEMAYAHLLTLSHGSTRFSVQKALANLRDSIAERMGMSAEETQNFYETEANIAALVNRISTPIPLTPSDGTATFTAEDEHGLFCLYGDRSQPYIWGFSKNGEMTLDAVRRLCNGLNARVAAPITPSDEMVEAASAAMAAKTYEAITQGDRLPTSKEVARAALTAALNLMGGD